MSLQSARRGALGLVVATGLVLSGCNDDGRTLEPTTATMPPTEIPDTTQVPVAVGLRVTSPDVVEGSLLDPAFTCDGDGRAPVLVLGGAPPAVAELAVAVVDLDADDAVHLLVGGLPSTATQLDPAQVPPEAVVGLTDADVLGWEAPCLAPGEDAHRYEVRLYAMAEPMGLAPGLPGRDAVALLEAAALEVARLGFTYAPAR